MQARKRTKPEQVNLYLTLQTVAEECQGTQPGTQSK